jgi:4-amino-4-deoxy-L-arabinose transferase-like glycosyltransferase
MKFVTSFLSRHKVPRILLAIVGIAACVLFFRLSHVDMIGDDAHYSVRSIGPVDFMFGDLDAQSTPMQWFEVVPWWTHLSFHDHPKILFVIQHFFLLLHPTAFFAKLPYTLFALATIVLMFFFVRRMEAKSALASSLLLVLNAHFIWMGRVAYMESGVMFCVLLALYYFLRFEKNDQEWWKFGAAFGLALGVKFTTLFLVPAVLAYMVINKREYFKNIRFYGAAAIALVMQAPLFIYNFAMYARTGHFSLQFARLFHQPSPWHLAGAQVSLKGWMNMFMSVGQSISWVYLGVFLVSVGYLVCRKRRYTLLLSATLFFAIQQFFIGDSGYAVSVFAIFIAPIVALSFIDCKELRQYLCGADRGGA